MFGIIAWSVWKLRNNVIFNGGTREVTSEVAGILAYAKSITVANRRRHQKNDQESNRICWQPPPKDWCKMGGAKHLLTVRSSVGGLFRDHKGKWITGYSRSIEICSIVDAEFWIIMDGLDIAWRRCIEQLMVESDSLLAVSTINGQSEKVGSNLV